MYSFDRSLLLLAFLCCFFGPGCKQESQEVGGQVAFEIPEADLIPEGIAYDPAVGTFFVGSTYKRKIVTVDRLGSTRDFVRTASDGLLGVVGMKVDTERRRLWAISSHAGTGMPMVDMDSTLLGTSRVHIYDIDQGALLQQFEIDNSAGRNFLNDLTLAATGDAYLTDTQTKRIYRISSQLDSLELFYQMDSSMSPNGIDISSDQSYLYIAVYGGQHVVRLSLADRELLTLELPPEERISADGLYYYHHSLITIQPSNETRRITRYDLDDVGTRITDLTVLADTNAHFIQPTTAVIADDQLYCIANSQLQVFRQWFAGNDSTTLKPPVVLKFNLKRESSNR